MGPAVRADGVRKVYRNGSTVEALAGVDVPLHAGELVAVVGPSGSGKSTLLNCLSGLEHLDEGRVEVEGHGLQRLSDDERSDWRARRMGFVVQYDRSRCGGGSQRDRAGGVRRRRRGDDPRTRRRRELRGVRVAVLRHDAAGPVRAGRRAGQPGHPGGARGHGAAPADRCPPCPRLPANGASLPFIVDLPPLAGVVLLVFVATAVVTVAPAERAARLPPAQVARHRDRSVRRHHRTGGESHPHT